MLLFIPAYWLYSIKYETLSSISVFQYRTYMNTVAILPDLIMTFLQKQNIYRKNVKNIDDETKESKEKLILINKFIFS